MEVELMEQFIEVNGQQISKEQFEEMQKNPNIRLKKISENCYKTLEKMEG